MARLAVLLLVPVLGGCTWLSENVSYSRAEERTAPQTGVPVSLPLPAVRPSEPTLVLPPPPIGIATAVPTPAARRPERRASAPSRAQPASARPSSTPVRPAGQTQEDDLLFGGINPRARGVQGR